MEFYTCFREKRPVRLSDATRSFAWDSLHHRYGEDTQKNMYVSLDHIPGVRSLSPLELYDLSVEEIVKCAPVRICDGELISGAATLGGAILHQVPVSLDGKSVLPSVSHLTLDFPTVLRIGINGIRQKAEESLRVHIGTEREAFLKSALHLMDCMKIWHERYLSALRERPGYEKNYENLCRVPFEPPKNFYQAVQSLWFVFSFVRLLGNWPGIGRIDHMLGDYLKRDLERGELTLQQAREILSHLFIKGCEWITGTSDNGSGDAQHYQNIVLSGIDEEGREVTNEVTYLVLDIIEELGISDFPTTVRLNRNTPELLLQRMAQVIRHGGGVLAAYNEETILESLTQYGYDLREARNFANDGCWEVQIPGKTCFNYVPFDSLALLQQVTLSSYKETPEFSDFESLYAAYLQALKTQVQRIYAGRIASFKEGAHSWKPATPCTAVSVFEEGCIEKGLSYFEGGPVYHVCSPHIGGLPDTVNSLYAIKKLVFDEKKVAFSDLMAILENNWENAEDLRQHALNRLTYYGNDNDEVDLLAARLLDDFAAICAAFDGKTPYRFPSGVSTFGRQLEWAPYRLATPFGKKKGQILAGNFSPTPGTDRAGATAIIKSYCKADLKKQVTGAALDVRLLPRDVAGDDGIVVLMGLLRGFVALGGYFIQFDIADAAILLAAQEHPEDYQTLSVRVSGWNARFVTLNREWQNMIIQEVKRP